MNYQNYNYEILFRNRNVEVMNYEQTSDLVDKLEMFERDDVSQIHLIKKSGELGKTIWTEEEGLFVRNF
jgi:hypothetical protein